MDEWITEKLEEPKMRRCLGECGEMFLSKHKGNRLCRRCDRVAQGGDYGGEGNTGRHIDAKRF